MRGLAQSLRSNARRNVCASVHATIATKAKRSLLDEAQLCLFCSPQRNDKMICEPSARGPVIDAMMLSLRVNLVSFGFDPNRRRGRIGRRAGLKIHGYAR